VPKAKDQIVIAAGDSVLLDVSTPSLASLNILGVVRVAEMPVVLTAARIQIGGVFEAGSRAQPHLTPLTIRIGGSRSTGDGMLDDALSVLRCGRLSLWGEDVRSWTSLAVDASQGDKRLVVTDEIGWHVGDSVVITPTGYQISDVEVRAVAGIRGKTITLSRGLSATHHGQDVSVAGRQIPWRASVGLLTRRIRIMPISMSVGAHVLTLPGGTMEAQGVEFYRLGQAGVVAHYPLHWHMMGKTEDRPQVAQSLSIWRSQQRCLVIHGTSDITVSNTVCALVPGHAVFLEDGAEQGSTLHRVLVAGVTVPPKPLVASDAKPTAFWISHPNNRLTENMASGAAGHGFWLAFPLASTGHSGGLVTGIRHAPLGVFADNHATSNAGAGLFVDDGPNPDGTVRSTVYMPSVVPLESARRVAAAFTRFTATHNLGGAIWTRGEHLTIADPRLLANPTGITMAGRESLIEGGVIAGLPRAQRGLVERLMEDRDETSGAAPSGGKGVGLADAAFLKDTSFRWKGIVFYDGPMRVRGTAFGAYPATGIGRGAALAIKQNNPFAMDPANAFSDVTMSDAVPLWIERAVTSPDTHHDGVAMSVIRDESRSLSAWLPRASRGAELRKSGGARRGPNESGPSSGSSERTEADTSVGAVGSGGRGVNTWSWVSDAPILRDKSCTYREEFQAWACPAGHAMLDLRSRGEQGEGGGKAYGGESGGDEMIPLQIERMESPTGVPKAGGSLLSGVIRLVGLSRFSGSPQVVASQSLSGIAGERRRAHTTVRANAYYRLRRSTRVLNPRGSPLTLDIQGLESGQWLALEIPLREGRVNAEQLPPTGDTERDMSDGSVPPDMAPLVTVGSWAELQSTTVSAAWVHAESKTLWVIIRSPARYRLRIQ